MSLTTTSDILLSEIVKVLSQNESLWSKCCCPEPATGLATDLLLQRLQNQFPASVWTLTLLETVLSMGTRRGLFKTLAGNWFIFQNFVGVNPTNLKFAAYAPGQICSLPPCIRPVTCCA